jgi:hypothetical protein
MLVDADGGTERTDPNRLGLVENAMALDFLHMKHDMAASIRNRSKTNSKAFSEKAA